MLSSMVHIGFGNVITMSRIVGIAVPGAAPTKRSINTAKESNMLIDMTNGRRTKAVIFLDNGHVVLSALSPETITGRLQVNKNPVISKNEIENEEA